MREAIHDPPHDLAVTLLESLFDVVVHDVVWEWFSVVYALSDDLAHFRVVLHLGLEDVSYGNMHHAELLS